jgi:putative transposase
MLAHCRDARYVWNLAVEQQQHRKRAGQTRYLEQAAQLTDAAPVRGRAGVDCSNRHAGISTGAELLRHTAADGRRPGWKEFQVGLKPHVEQ